MNAAAPGWQPDPTNRHEYRYWDGSRWTDDVSDGGVTSVDPLAGPGVGGQPSGEAPTAAMGEVGGPEATRPMQQWGQGPAGMPPGVSGPPSYGGGPGDPYGGSYSGQVPPGQPVRKGPSPALLIAIAVLVVLAIGGVAYALSQGGDDNETADSTTTSVTATDSTLGSSTTAGGGDSSSTTAGGGGSDTTEGGGGSGGDNSALVEEMATAIESSSAGALDHEQSVCVAEAMLDEFGFERLAEIGLSGESGTDAMNQLTPEEQQALINLMMECAPGLTGSTGG